jgi:Zn-dependent protease
MPALDSLTTIISFIILIFSVILHEIAHGYAADTLGDPTARLSGRLTLNPLPHIDIVGSILVPALLLTSNAPIFFGWAKPVPYNPYNLKNQRWGEALVAGAGSLTNLSIALIFGLIVRFGFGLSENALTIAAIISLTNLFLGLFNLIPFPPLDGFTVLRGVLPWKSAAGLERFAASMQSLGLGAMILFLFVFSFIFSGPFYNFVIFTFRNLVGQ